MDGHAGLYSTEPIVEFYQASSTYTYTYPPNVAPAEAEWWTMPRSEEHTSELQSLVNLVCRLLLEKKKTGNKKTRTTQATDTA